MTVEDKLFLLTFYHHEKSHLVIKDQEVCRKCPTMECNYACPAKVYTWQEDRKETNVNYENCVECGTCRFCCPYDNIDWNNPQGGYGVAYRYG